MAVAFSDGESTLLQFIALALPAIALYLQVLVSVHQKTENLELSGSVPNYVDEEGNREPEKEPNVIEALPTSVTQAHERVAFVLALISGGLLTLAASVLLLQILYEFGSLFEVASGLTALGLVFLFTSIIITVIRSVRLISQ